MKVLDIFGTLHTRTSVQPLLIEQINTISTECSQFLNESGDLPVFKNLNKTRTFTKLKARIRKSNDGFSESFNSALAPKLRQRAIFAHGHKQLCESDGQTYYMFPTNGFKYAYNIQISNSSIYEDVYKGIDNKELFEELLQHNYTNENLNEGIHTGAEILFHGIPFCYAVNTSAFGSYRELLSIL